MVRTATPPDGASDAAVAVFFQKKRSEQVSFSSEFKEFALKGNVMDLAVGVIIGGAFEIGRAHV